MVHSCHWENASPVVLLEHWQAHQLRTTSEYHTMECKCDNVANRAAFTRDSPSLVWKSVSLTATNLPPCRTDVQPSDGGIPSWPGTASIALGSTAWAAPLEVQLHLYRCKFRVADISCKQIHHDSLSFSMNVAWLARPQFVWLGGREHQPRRLERAARGSHWTSEADLWAKLMTAPRPGKRDALDLAQRYSFLAPIRSTTGTMNSNQTPACQQQIGKTHFGK